MRICIAADFSGHQDEGFKNIAFNLSRELSAHHNILKLDMSRLFSPGLWQSIKEFHPDIIHYIPGRTVKSFLVLKILALYSGRAKTIMSAFHSDIACVPGSLVVLLRPDLILTQADEVERKFKGLNCAVDFLPNGVDTEKFRPVSPEIKEGLRRKYGIDRQKFVVLHVGHLIKARNLQILSKIQGAGNQVIVVSSLYRKMDNMLYGKLRDSGCIVWREHIKNIEEIYSLADCYVFPVEKGYSVLMPLSVMEAMACNLPVISTRFEGLAKFFEGGNGLTYVEREEDILTELNNLKDSNVPIDNREKVRQFSWKNLSEKLSAIYSEAVT